MALASSGTTSCDPELYICFNPTFSAALSMSGHLRSNLQGCWATVQRENNDTEFRVKCHGLSDATSCSWLRPQTENKEAQVLEAAWAMTELLQWQLGYALKALPDNNATFSMFLSDKCANPHKIEWITMPRYFERTVTASQLHVSLQTMFKLLGIFRLPPPVPSLLVDTSI